MRHIYRIFSILLLLLLSSRISAQDEGLKFVKAQYPQLSVIFEKELVSEHATYTFAIDVSGTMKKYSTLVQPALKEFVKALPEGDFVRIIRFGTYAKGDENGYLGVVNSNLRKDLMTAIDNLYSNTNDDKAFKAYTDIPEMMTQVSSSIQKSSNEMNFVFILTDFRNDQKGKGECILSSQDIDDMYEKFDAAAFDKEGRIVALQLPVNTAAKGYCLEELKEGVLSKSNMSYEMQPITSDAALTSWFSDLKKEIMVDRLRSIVRKENRVAEVSFETKIDIDGNVKAHVSWEPNRLFDQINIDTSRVVSRKPDSLSVNQQYVKGFCFKNNEKAFLTTSDTDLDLKLGRIKNKGMGFHKFSENVKLGVSLPTPYDQEFRKLGIRKPIPNVSTPVDKVLFSFFLPLWSVSLILLLLLIYIILLFRAIMINSKYKFNLSVDIYDMNDNKIGSTVMPRKTNVKLPSAVTCTPTPDGWSFDVLVRKGNPFLLFKRPRVVIRKGKGFQGSISGKTLKSSRLTSRMLTLYCGQSPSDITHKLEIKKR